jgi:glycerol dehydrogenase-like iron-containing ADH family enzyme
MSHWDHHDQPIKNIISHGSAVSVAHILQVISWSKYWHGHKLLAGIIMISLYF